MCQNKKIYSSAIIQKYSLVTSLLNHLKQNLLYQKYSSSNTIEKTSTALIEHHVQSLIAQQSRLSYLMKSILSQLHIQMQEYNQSSQVQFQTKRANQDDLQIYKANQFLPQSQSIQESQSIMIKKQYYNQQACIRGPYRSYTIQQKQQVLKLHKNGMNYARISKLLKIPQKNIVRWCKTGIYRKQGAGRKIGDMIMQQKLKQYLQANYEAGSQIVGKQIREKAKKLTKKTTFKSSKGWLKNFINRYKLSSKYVIL